MLDLEKAQRTSLTMQVEASLKGALIIGALKPGARLITKEIADQLGTSITPVREALLRLVSAGALHATPAQAFLVPEVSLERYNEINLIRKNLEGMAARSASQNMTKDKIRELRMLAGSFHEALKSGNTEQTLQANRAFRFSVYQQAGMPTLTALIEQLWVRIGPCFNYLYPSSAELSRGHDYSDLLAALEEGDGFASERALWRAIDEGATIINKQFHR
ncbi:GntR family transcriptional regulator, colanic acid and biofilm gene transcriptional regulator [Kosakonia oryzendophytica]|uniref:GntR family transcriptional regulator, colanic acid and biofilm gene transcriptional regulator n=1 Tax=Kosakonia oryzendophytica TaxID=1005665 RepID=A0A1C4BNE5_9ENTR|nr:GntR family transcriptional regulator [Kosakonia oryzendophytica]AMO49571.1 HTH-type transcriptional regulator mcbR [Enterobacter sp. FY-07]TDT59551.1 GntR family colanic acid and biofilm gene transcriptional regulator [Enterobacter sp. AG5470]WBT60489.1 GntR family transcriptional regulator [Kosakonia oryzendophytica]SCC08426.1 GntR family transcriptional regulator, colanic acid and biofilm gene transcriptional regulator [Kosakonia oryzendophytica]